MLKKILYTLLFIVLAAGTVYSWQKLEFGRKTAQFFQVVFGDENSMGGPGGQRPMGENRGGEMSGPEPPSMAGGEGRGAVPELGQRGNRAGGPRGNGGPGGAPGGNISLGDVAKYTVIMAFFVMLTRLLDRLVLGLSRSRKAA